MGQTHRCSTPALPPGSLCVVTSLVNIPQILAASRKEAGDWAPRLGLLLHNTDVATVAAHRRVPSRVHGCVAPKRKIANQYALGEGGGGALGQAHRWTTPMPPLLLRLVEPQTPERGCRVGSAQKQRLGFAD